MIPVLVKDDGTFLHFQAPEGSHALIRVETIAT
jgi:hypothetical protein